MATPEEIHARFGTDPNWRENRTAGTAAAPVEAAAAAAPAGAPVTSQPNAYGERLAGIHEQFGTDPNWRDNRPVRGGQVDNYGMGITSALMRGYERLMSLPDVMQGDFEELAEHNRAMDEYKMSDEDTARLEEIRETDGFWNKAGELMMEPRLVLQVVAESLPMMVAPIAGAVGGGVAGTAVAPGAGTVAGSMIGGGMGSYFTEYYASIGEFFGEEGINMKNAAELKAAFQDQRLMDAAREFAHDRGVPIAIFDALSMGLAGRIAKPIAGVVGKVSKPVSGVVGQAGELVMQSGFGMAGEAGAQLSSTGEIHDELDVLMEGFAEFAPGIVEGVVGRQLRKRADAKAAGIDDPNTSPLAALDKPAPEEGDIGSPIAATDIDPQTGQVVTRTGDRVQDELDVGLEDGLAGLQMELEARAMGIDADERAAAVDKPPSAADLDAIVEERGGALAEARQIEEDAAYQQREEQDAATVESEPAESTSLVAPGFEQISGDPRTPDERNPQSPNYRPATGGETVTTGGTAIEGEPVDMSGAQPIDEGMILPEGVNPVGGRPATTSLGEALRAAGWVPPPDDKRPPPGGGGAGGGVAIGPDVTPAEQRAAESLADEAEAMEERFAIQDDDQPFVDDYDDSIPFEPLAPEGPQPAVEWADERLAKSEYHDGLDRLVGETQEGGGVVLVPSDEIGVSYSHRTPSQNPEWMQDIISEEGIGRKDVINAVEKAKAGKRLGVRQKRIIQSMLDALEEPEVNPREAEIEAEAAAFDAEVAPQDQLPDAFTEESIAAGGLPEQVIYKSDRIKVTGISRIEGDMVVSGTKPDGTEIRFPLALARPAMIPSEDFALEQQPTRTPDAPVVEQPREEVDPDTGVVGDLFSEGANRQTDLVEESRKKAKREPGTPPKLVLTPMEPAELNALADETDALITKLAAEGDGTGFLRTEVILGLQKLKLHKHSRADEIAQKITALDQGEVTAPKAKLPSRRLRVKVGDTTIEVLQNPNTEQMQLFRQTIRMEQEEQGLNPDSDPITRSSYDVDGNQWVWESGDAIHVVMEDAISAHTGIKDLNQNQEDLTGLEERRDTSRQADATPEQVAEFEKRIKAAYRANELAGKAWQRETKNRPEREQQRDARVEAVIEMHDVFPPAQAKRLMQQMHNAHIEDKASGWGMPDGLKRPFGFVETQPVGDTAVGDFFETFGYSGTERYQVIARNEERGVALVLTIASKAEQAEEGGKAYGAYVLFPMDQREQDSAGWGTFIASEDEKRPAGTPKSPPSDKPGYAAGYFLTRKEAIAEFEDRMAGRQTVREDGKGGLRTPSANVMGEQDVVEKATKGKNFRAATSDWYTIEIEENADQKIEANLYKHEGVQSILVESGMLSEYRGISDKFINLSLAASDAHVSAFDLPRVGPPISMLTEDGKFVSVKGDTFPPPKNRLVLDEASKDKTMEDSDPAAWSMRKQNSRMTFGSQADAESSLEEWKAEAKRIGATGVNNNKVIMSLFDATGTWSQPYIDAGYVVIRYDSARGDDIHNIDWFQQIEAIKEKGYEIAGVMAAPPCTSFSSAGAQWWGAQHDNPSKEWVRKKYGELAAFHYDKPIEYAEAIMTDVVAIVDLAQPTEFHAMENPSGRLRKMLKEGEWNTDIGLPSLSFDPWHFGDPYTKRTHLWGEMNTDLPEATVVPVEGSKMHKMHSGAESIGGERSATPEGFSYAFFIANHNTEPPAGGTVPPGTDPHPMERRQRPRGAPIESDITEAPDTTMTLNEAREIGDDSKLTQAGFASEEALSEASKKLTMAEQFTQQGVAETQESIGDVVNPKVAGLVSGLNKANIITTMSGDLYANDLVYVDLRGPVASSVMLPVGWVVTGTDAALTHADITGDPLVYANGDPMPDDVAASRRLEANGGRSRIARAGKKKVSQADIKALVAALSHTALRPAAVSETQIAAAEADTNTSPTDAQVKANNYKKGRLTLPGEIEFSVESPRGEKRHGNLKLRDTYGEFPKAQGADGDPMDAFVNAKMQEDWAGDVYVVDQIFPEVGGFDEHKVMFGYNNMIDARRAYRRNYNKDWKGQGAVTKMTLDEFKTWLAEPGPHKTPASHSNVTEAGRKERAKANKKLMYSSGKYILGADKEFVDKVLGGGEKKMGDMPDTVPMNVAVSELLAIEEERVLAQDAPEDFGTWFADSKAVDKEGAPIVVFHGTDQGFETFDPTTQGQNTGAPSAKEGFFFTSKMRSAEYYSRGQAPNITSAWRRAKYEGTPGPSVKSVYLSLQNPLIHDFKGKVYRETTYAELIERAKAAGHDGVIMENTYDAGEYSKMDAILNGRFSGETIYVAFEASQIKSVDQVQRDSAPAVSARPSFEAIAAAIKPVENSLPGAPVTLLHNYKQAPAAVAKSMQAQGMTQVKAVFDPQTGQIYIFADQIVSIDEAVRASLHEKTHRGLRIAFGNRLNPLLDDIYKNANDVRQVNMNTIAERYKSIDPNTRQGRRDMAEELLTHMAEHDVTDGIVNRAVAFIRKLLRDMGITMEFTDNDIRAIIREAQGSITRKQSSLAGVTITEEVTLAETGEVFEIEQDADIALTGINDRIEICKKLRACV